MKPWDPPEERLYPVVDDLLGDWRRANPEQTNEVRLVGHRWSERSHDLKTFLARNHVPYRWYDVETDDEGRRLSALAGARAGRAAAGAGPGRGHPAGADHARRRGRPRPARPGPAAALRRVHRRRRTGRAGRRGVRRLRGAADGAGRARGPRRAGRAERLDRELPRLPPRAERRRPRAPRPGPGEPVRRRDGAGPGGRGLRDPRTGPRGAAGRLRRDRGPRGDPGHRRLLPPAAAAGLDDLVGRGVYYGADAAEASQCAGDDVYIVGAANSAGQAALNLARFARQVVLVVRRASLTETMSQYLLDRISAAPNIVVRCRSEVVAGPRRRSTWRR